VKVLSKNQDDPFLHIGSCYFAQRVDIHVLVIPGLHITAGVSILGSDQVKLNTSQSLSNTLTSNIDQPS